MAMVPPARTTRCTRAMASISPSTIRDTRPPIGSRPRSKPTCASRLAMEPSPASPLGARSPCRGPLTSIQRQASSSTRACLTCRASAVKNCATRERSAPSTSRPARTISIKTCSTSTNVISRRHSGASAAGRAPSKAGRCSPIPTGAPPKRSRSAPACVTRTKKSTRASHACVAPSMISTVQRRLCRAKASSAAISTHARSISPTHRSINPGTISRRVSAFNGAQARIQTSTQPGRAHSVAAAQISARPR